MKKEKVQKEKAVRRTSIGGQAVLEGVMMKGEHTIATAVRTEAGEITYETKRIKSPKERNIFFRLPFIRGVVNLVTQLGQGMGILMRSAEVYGDYAEPTKTEKWMAKKLKIDPMKVLMAVSLILGFLIIYASRFLIKKRNKEFGIYMILGMSKRRISIVLLLETFFIATIS